MAGLVQNPVKALRRMQNDPLFGPLVDLFLRGKHFVFGLEAGNMNLLDAQPASYACAIEGHAAAADYRQPLADLARAPKVDAAQEADGVVYAGKIFAGNRQLSAFVGARSNH